MRRIAFALALVLASGWAEPSRAQWWGGGWQRPCFGACGPWNGIGGGGVWRPRRFVVWGAAPRPFWGGSADIGPRTFGPGRWGWRRVMWRREMRRRWFEGWDHGGDSGRGAVARAEPRPPAHRWMRRWSRWRRPLPESAVARRSVPDEQPAPLRSEAAVAIVPAGALRRAQPMARAAVPIRLTAAAAMLHRPFARADRPAAIPAIAAVPLPAASLRDAAPSRPHRATVAEPLVRPAALTSQPAPAARPSAAATAASTPAPSAAIPATDVPVAPRD